VLEVDCEDNDDVSPATVLDEELVLCATVLDVDVS
jgi:hypothetical protein